jgi:hypothetical protein
MFNSQHEKTKATTTFRATTQLHINPQKRICLNSLKCRFRVPC